MRKILYIVVQPSKTRYFSPKMDFVYLSTFSLQKVLKASMRQIRKRQGIFEMKRVCHEEI